MGDPGAQGENVEHGLAHWCASCGHAKTTHVGFHRCGGLSRVGPGNEYDGGDFASCRCDGFVPLSDSGRRPSDG